MEMELVNPISIPVHKRTGGRPNTKCYYYYRKAFAGLKLTSQEPCA